MSPIKYQVNKVTSEGYNRLHIIDDIISKSVGSTTREDLLKRVNLALTDSDKIEQSTLDKDIRRLKEYLEERAPDVLLKYNKLKGYYYSKPNFCLFSTSLDDEETSALLMAKELFQLLKGTTLQPKFDEVVQKIMQLSLNDDSTLQELKPSYIQIAEGLPGNGIQWIEFILKAIYNKDALFMKYRKSDGTPSERHISPYFIKQYQNRWYMLARDHGSSRPNKELVFSLSGIQDITYSNQPFVPPAINIQDYFMYSLGIWHEYDREPMEVGLQFLDNRILLGVLSNPIHHSQTVINDDQQGGSIITIKVYPGPELEGLILSYADKVKVLYPDKLVERIRHKIDQMKRLYST